jgi:hypothetical protein
VLGWAYGSDLLRPRERVDEGGGLKESRLPAGFEGPKLGIRDGGANSTLIDGGAI